MPLYDYECSSCGNIVEDVFQKVDDKPLKKCPECKKYKLFKVMSGGLHVSVKDVKTLGQLADYNSKKHKSQIQEAEHKKLESQPKQEKSWSEKHGGNATKREINKMNEHQKIKYIMEGRK